MENLSDLRKDLITSGNQSFEQRILQNTSFPDKYMCCIRLLFLCDMVKNINKDIVK